VIDAIWTATALGLIGGVALVYVIGSALARRFPSRSLAVRLALAGAAIAVLPAFFLSFVVGGTLGGAWGEHLLGRIGMRSSGVPVGLALGISLVFACVVLVGATVGVLLGKAVLCYQQWRVRT
jgi:hypothetical protein